MVEFTQIVRAGWFKGMKDRAVAEAEAKGTPRREAEERAIIVRDFGFDTFIRSLTHRHFRSHAELTRTLAGLIASMRWLVESLPCKEAQPMFEAFLANLEKAQNYDHPMEPNLFLRVMWLPGFEGLYPVILDHVTELKWVTAETLLPILCNPGRQQMFDQHTSGQLGMMLGEIAAGIQNHNRPQQAAQQRAPQQQRGYAGGSAHHAASNNGRHDARNSGGQNRSRSRSRTPPGGQQPPNIYGANTGSSFHPQHSTPSGRGGGGAGSGGYGQRGTSAAAGARNPAAPQQDTPTIVRAFAGWCNSNGHQGRGTAAGAKFCGYWNVFGKCPKATCGYLHKAPPGFDKAAFIAANP